MKFYQLLLFVLLFASNSFSQCDTNRYRSAIFSDVYKLEDVQYGEAPVWSIPYNDTELLMDIYEPINDAQTKRPLMIWIHPGGFLTGDKSADDMTALCDSFARKGYVTVSLGYRLGFNPLSNSSAQRAVYRSVQDVRAAIRYLYEFADVYDIDTNYTFVGGSSAGAVTTLHLAYLDQNEAPTSIQGGTLSPNLGDLDDSGNAYSHAINLTGIVSLWGGLGDSLYVNSNETTPALLIHGTNDGVVSYGVGSPFGAPTLDPLHGSRCIHNRLDDLSIPHSFYPFVGLDHEFHGADNGAFNSPPNAYWDTLLHLIDSHYVSLVLPDVTPIAGTQMLCEAETATYSMMVNVNETGCWNVSGGTILQDWGDSISVLWNQPGIHTISAHVVNEIGAYSSEIVHAVTINTLPPQINFGVSIANNQVSIVPDSLNFSYEWDFGDGSQSNVVSPVHTYANSGIYEISMIASNPNDCSVTNSELIYIEILGTTDLAETTFSVYPTVTSSQVTIDGILETTDFQLLDNMGRVVLSGNLEAGKNSLSVQKLNTGVYFGRINGYSESFRLVVQR